MREGWATHQISENDSYIEHGLSGSKIPLSIKKNLLLVPYSQCCSCYLTEEQAEEDMEVHPTYKMLSRQVDDPIPERPRLPRLKINTALGLHQRLGHLTVPGNEVECPECLQGKGQRKAVSKYRAPELEVPIPFEQISVDYWGPVRQESMGRGKSAILFVAICDASSCLLGVPDE